MIGDKDISKTMRHRIQLESSYIQSKITADIGTKMTTALGREEPWKTQAYWKLPKNVRRAIDESKVNATLDYRTNFSEKLDTLNEKINIYKSVFYSKKPSFEKVFIQRQENKHLKVDT